MTPKLETTFWWIFAVIFTIAIAQYQKRTGPTYPVSGKTTLNNKEINYKLIRTAENETDARISITVPDETVKGMITFKRFKSHDSLTSAEMIRSIDTTYNKSLRNLWNLIAKKPLDFNLNSNLTFMMPRLAAAGKMMYDITLQRGAEQVKIAGKDGKPVVMRFKGHVPLQFLIPHVLCMFLGLLFSTRTAIEALIKGTRTYKYALLTLLFLIPGGLILGPFVQKFAFGAYWTGWPFGHDLTDNKTLIMVIAWVVAVIKLRKDPQNKIIPLIAAAMVLIVYLIPHSVLGSEIDYTKIVK